MILKETLSKGLPSAVNVTKLRKAGSRGNAGPGFFVTIFKKHLTNTVKCAAFLLTAVSKKAFVIRGIPTPNYKEAHKCQVKYEL